MESSKKSATPRRANPNIEGLVVGALVGPHGVRGEVKLYPETDFPERLSQFKEFRLRFPDGREERRAVRAMRPNRGMFLVRFEGVETRNDAEALRGAAVVIDLDQAAPLPEGHYYHHDLVGLRVVTPEGEELGTIREIWPGASNDVYVAGKYLIPATRDAIARIAPEEGLIVVRSREYLEGEELR